MKTDSLLECHERIYLTNVIEQCGGRLFDFLSGDGPVDGSRSNHETGEASPPPTQPGSSSSSGKTKEPPAAIAFLEHTCQQVFEKKPELWKSLMFTVKFVTPLGPVSFEGESHDSWNSIISEITTWFKEGDIGDMMVGKLIITSGDDSKTFSSPFNTRDAAVFLNLIRGDLQGLKDYLGSPAKLLPLRKLNGDAYLKANVRIVDVEPSQSAAKDFFAQHAAMQGDKTYAVVVAGESGSGKSVYACQQALDCGHVPVHHCLAEDAKTKKQAEEASDNSEKAGSPSRQKNMELQGLMDQKPVPEHELLNDFLRLFVVVMESKQKVGCRAVHSLYSMKSKLNTNRSIWATKVLDAAIKATVESDANALEWLEGHFHEDALPEKVAIIIDEATDIDLAEGLVATVRETTAKYQEGSKKLARDDVLLVIAGTGLDLIQYKDRVGTNPHLSKLTVLKRPNINNVSKVVPREVVTFALENGTFARIFRTNARMLFRSLIPILQSPFHSIDGYSEEEESEREIKRRRYETRLQAVASTRCIMDHAPRFYVNQNSVGKLTSTVRQELLCQAFVYHLSEPMKKLEKSDKSYRREIQQNNFQELEQLTGSPVFNALQENTVSGIFSKGLANRTETSNAWKYLACFGLTEPVRAQFGDDFEKLTALHLMRYMEVFGFECHPRKLKNAWLPKWNDTDSILDTSQFIEEDFELIEGCSNNCLVFEQGTPNAQGADVLALLVRPEGASLMAIQCKHYVKSPGPKKIREEWWPSLGVEFTEKTVNLEPSSGSAGYAFQGLDAFRRLLEKMLGSSVKLGDRILAASFPTPEKSTNFPIPQSHGIRVWFREMFEPTMSVLTLKTSRR